VVRDTSFFSHRSYKAETAGSTSTAIASSDTRRVHFPGFGLGMEDQSQAGDVRANLFGRFCRNVVGVTGIPVLSAAGCDIIPSFSLAEITPQKPPHLPREVITQTRRLTHDVSVRHWQLHLFPVYLYRILSHVHTLTISRYGVIQ
jgi:hypothetical protein